MTGPDQTTTELDDTGTAGSRDRVALVLSVCLGVCLLLVTAAVAWGTVAGDTLDEPGSRLLGVLLGGLLGVIGAYLGFHTGQAKRPTP